MANDKLVRLDEGDKAAPRFSGASRRSRRSGRFSKSFEADEKPAFDVLLSCRTADPISDAHSADIKQLPEHWAPTLISNLTRAASQGFLALDPERQEEERRRFSEKHKPSGSWRRRVFRPAQEQSHTEVLLPRLYFRNPFDSFRAPGIKDMLSGGLKWGLPEGYQEGDGTTRFRGNKISAAKKVRRQVGAGVSQGLEEGWDRVEVKTPDWGWPTPEQDADRKADPAGSAESTTEAEANGHAQGNGHADGNGPAAPNGDVPLAVSQGAADPNPTKAPKDRPEWMDPNHDSAPAARVTWLGHATTLLQLPSLSTSEEDDDEVKPTGEAEPQQQPVVAETAGEADSPVNNPAVDSEQGEQRAENEESAPPADGDSAPKTDDNGSAPTPRHAPREQLGNRSINILFDPVFSERCSPSQNAGPKRFTPVPCQIDDLPPIDIVCISHSHFDHLDYLTMKALRKQRGRKIHAFVGLGLKERIMDFGWSEEQVSELDWWDSAVLQVHEPQANVFSNPDSVTVATGGDNSGNAPVVESKLVSKIRQDRAKLRIVCTPAQHGSGRGAGDKDQTLWCSWVVEWISPKHSASASTEHRIPAIFRAFFAGDTGLKYHRDNVEKRYKYPACPAFEQIATRIGKPDLLLLPISVGSSLSYFRSWDPFPRSISPFPRVSAALTSSIHMDPYDAVEMHEIMRTAADGQNAEAKDATARDLETKRLPVSLAVHYGTFVRNRNQTEGDVRQLRDACRRSRLAFRRSHHGRFDMNEIQNENEDREKGLFLVSNQGETVWIPFLWVQQSKA